MKKVQLILLLFLGIILGCKEESNTKPEATDEAKDEMVKNSVNDQSTLASSPRHHEWVDFNREDGTILKAFVVYPETSAATKSVIAIHENRGLNDWARTFADQLASEGFLVIAPDLISNTVEGLERTIDFADSDKAREAIYALDPKQVTKDLDACFEYIKNDKASTGTVSVAGFCWGGSQTFRYATNNNEIEQALVFYGTAPDDPEVFNNINAPVYGFYGGNDNRVNSTIEQTETYMKDAGKTYEYKIYDGAGHAFMRSGHQTDDSEDPNKMAHDEAWERLLRILK